ncbi:MULTISPECIES: type II toxin-antitoxin system PemK/MazF family toxin [Enterococcus]|uniref:type II toxin-antitoxin system PemK/MazF family toxin n=1 Tax=Enterococcus TaxID=1350 RepID=UPI0002F7E2F8|nr:type II toxin-antitoxin system PemK/MazF family toxin [Enterococcus mundtii]MBO1085616.1 type II toxin-antitoxin system PemK/MazF family toxin [Enterococcus mundtii]MDB7102500.1 type II toxin-antitoxin system PemK/MazF family toxin [Enterococcus mundtii]MDV7745897.1 type II toxin-antitoxin system PemK/MazF family toxin [Enterococcus mundtii]
MVKQGDIIFIDLGPTKGNELAKKRPCVIISNNNYNKIFNTVLVMPISSSTKYLQEKHQRSGAFQTISDTVMNTIKGTILCQHIRSIDLSQRSNLQVVDQIDPQTKERLSEIAKYFF